MANLNKRRVTLIVISLVILLGAAGAVWAWQTPLLGESLPARKTQQPAVSPDKDTAPATAPTEPTAMVPTQAAPHPAPVCGGPETLNLLVLGIDPQAQADAIRLIHLDFTAPRALILSIPRDFYVQIVDMADYGITRGRINATFAYGEYYNGRGQGVVSTAENLYHNFGVTFDDYAVVQFRTVSKLIDQIGGVTIELDSPVDGRLQNQGYYAAGRHHLDGQAALGFMRIRYLDTDFHRVDRQTLVLQALFSQARRELNLFQQTQLGLIALGDRSVQTSLAAKDLPALVCLARTLEKDQIHFVRIPGDYYRSATTTSGANVQIPQDGAADFIYAVMAGEYSPE